MVAHRHNNLHGCSNIIVEPVPVGPGGPGTVEGHAAPVRHREGRRGRLRTEGTGQGVDVRLRAHRLRPAAPRPRPVLAGVRRAAPLPRVERQRGHLRLEHHRCRRQHHQPGAVRGAQRGRGGRRVRSDVVGGDGRHRRAASHPRPACHRVRRPHGRAGRAARGLRRRVRDERRRVLPGGADRGLRAAGPPVARLLAGRGSGGELGREAVAGRLRAVEEGHRRCRLLAVTLGQRPSRVAHRVRGDGPRPAR